MTFKKLREASGLNKTEFSKKYGITYRTVQNWESGERKCPEYVLALLEEKVMRDRKRAIIIMKKVHKDFDGKKYKGIECKTVSPDGKEEHEWFYPVDSQGMVPVCIMSEIGILVKDGWNIEFQ